jgi:hypothetical protein
MSRGGCTRLRIRPQVSRPAAYFDVMFDGRDEAVNCQPNWMMTYLKSFEENGGLTKRQ